MHHHPSVLIIGGGRVGQMLGYLWVSHQLVNVIAVCNSTLTSAQKACQFIGQGQAHCDLQTCPSADIILVTTPDDQLPSIMAWLSTWSNMQEDTIVMHCSGCLSSSDLGLPDRSAYQLASVHPVMSIASPETAIVAFDQTMCGYEGSSAALSVLLPLFESIGGVPFELIPQQKAAYHAGMVMASNYLVGLADSSRACLQQAGLSEEIASSLVGQIMQQTLMNINLRDKNLLYENLKRYKRKLKFHILIKSIFSFLYSLKHLPNAINYELRKDKKSVIIFHCKNY